MATAPLFRVEYVRNQRGHLPSSHIHVHAHRDEFTHLLGFAHKLNAAKDKKIHEYLERTPILSGFHFPTGGHRFRPCLEDILEALRYEFNLDVDNKRWKSRLTEARTTWREIQTASVVRDSPEVALRILTEEFGMPAPEAWQPPATNLEKLTRS